MQQPSLEWVTLLRRWEGWRPEKDDAIGWQKKHEVMVMLAMEQRRVQFHGESRPVPRSARARKLNSSAPSLTEAWRPLLEHLELVDRDEGQFLICFVRSFFLLQR